MPMRTPPPTPPIPPIPPLRSILPPIFDADQPSFYLTRLHIHDLDRLRWRITAENPAALVRLVRGTHMHSKDSLIAEFASAFQFPLHIGNNWDALSDALSDLSWLTPAPERIGLFIADAEHVLIHADDFADPFFTLLQDRAAKPRLKPFRVLFQVSGWQEAGELALNRFLEKCKRSGIDPLPFVGLP